MAGTNWNNRKRADVPPHAKISRQPFASFRPVGEPPAGGTTGSPPTPYGVADPTADPLSTLRDWGVMAVVTGVDGPHYRNLGAFMAFAADGRAAGQLTSGCIERDLALHAIDVAATGRPKTLRYGAGSPYLDLQLPCGGALEVSLLRADTLTISKVLARRHARRPSRLGLDLVGGGMALDGPGFVLDIMPQTAFSVWGAGIEAVTFVALAHAAGFPARLHSHDETTLMSAHAHGVATAGPRWDDADSWTAVVMFYHDHDREPPLLREALRSDAFYIGAQGSLRSDPLAIPRFLPCRFWRKSWRKRGDMCGMDRPANMTCVALAAGYSLRWGQDNKLLATWRGQPLVWHAARLLRGVPCRRRGVVCRDAGVASFFPDAIHLRPCGEEQSDSLHRAVSFAANHKADFLLILLADMPDLTLEDVALVSDAVTEERPAAAIHSGGRFGPPACFPKAMFTRMTRIAGDKGAGQLLQDAKGVPIPAAHLVDVDRPADIAAEWRS